MGRWIAIRSKTRPRTVKSYCLVLALGLAALISLACDGETPEPEASASPTPPIASPTAPIGSSSPSASSDPTDDKWAQAAYFVADGVSQFGMTADVIQPVELHFEESALGGDRTMYMSCAFIPTIGPEGPPRVSFQAIVHPNDVRQQPRLEFTDDGQGAIIGGLFAGGREWEFTQEGRSITAISVEFGRLERGRNGDYDIYSASDYSSADGMLLIVGSKWSGEATDNLTSEQTFVEIRSYCYLVSNVFLNYVTPQYIRQSFYNRLDAPSLDIVP